MALLTVQRPVEAGITPTYAAAAAGGDTYTNTGRTIFHVKNGGGSPINVTFTSTVNPAPSGTAATNKVVAVTNGEERMVAVATAGFNNANGIVSVTYSAVTSVTVGVFEV